MKPKIHLPTLLLLLFCLTSTPYIYGQEPEVKRKKSEKRKVREFPQAQKGVYKFSFSPESGSELIIPIEFKSPRLRIRVVWRGTSKWLSATLKNQEDENRYLYTEGSSPLVSEFEIGFSKKRGSNKWMLVLKNMDSQKKAKGKVALSFPEEEIIVEAAPATAGDDVLKKPISKTAFRDLNRCSWGEGVKSFPTDSTYRVDYPNGNYVERTGKGTFYYDAETNTLFYLVYLMAGVIGAEEPPEITSFTGVDMGNEWLTDFYNWLEGVNENELNKIKKLMDNKEELIQKFLEKEASLNFTAFGKLKFRMKTIEDLEMLLNE